MIILNRLNPRFVLRGLGLTAASLFLLCHNGGSQVTAQCGPNPIVCENVLTGNLKSEWDITGSGDSTLQGFATDISANKGDTVHFKVTTTAANFKIDIYRLGYYGGMGARKIGSIANITGKVQPACLADNTTNLIDCGNWTESTTWVVPATAVSGIYIAKLTRTDTGGASHVVFVVRDDASTSELLMQTDDTTWQAYNQYGGFSLYTSVPARKVSYNRPFSTRGQSGGFGPSDWVFSTEYPMVRWLEANGYNVSYTSGLDTDRRGTLIKNHKVFLSVGHDEYWSGPAAHQRRGRAHGGRPSGLLQRQRSLLEDAVGSEHRWLRDGVSHAGELQGDARQSEDRPAGSADVDRHLARPAFQPAR